MNPNSATPTSLEDQIREAAYFDWLDRGCPVGDEWAHWFAAEQQLAVVSPGTEQAGRAHATPRFQYLLTSGQGTEPSLHLHATPKVRDDRPEIRAGGAVQRTRARQHGGRNS
jgi:hypothetical protein